MLAVSLGLQTTLSSLTNGIVLIFTKPFVAGDYVDIGGAAGTVKEIKLFSVKIVTPDNITVIVPNSTVLSSVIINYSRLPIRRLDLVVPVSYGADIAKVKQVVLDIVNADARVQKNPEPFFRLTEYGASSLNFTLRVWTLTGEFWNVKFDVMEKIVEAFRANGLEIPFNQLDVHVMPTEVH
jgi:small conductance mechanosensitive channel